MRMWPSVYGHIGILWKFGLSVYGEFLQIRVLVQKLVCILIPSVYGHIKYLFVGYLCMMETLVKYESL